jgi:hypothetical protein
LYRKQANDQREGKAEGSCQEVAHALISLNAKKSLS